MQKPTFSTSNAPNGPAQLAQVADFAEQGWRFRSGTAAQRAALASDEKFSGLVWQDTDSIRGQYEWNGSAWVPIGAAQSTRQWTYPRAGNSLDTFSSGSFVGLLTGTISSAPAGQYLIGFTLSMGLMTSAAAVGYLRVQAGPSGGQTNISSDTRHDMTSQFQIVSYMRPFTWSGGNLKLDVSVQISAHSAGVYKDGSAVFAVYLGP